MEAEQRVSAYEKKIRVAAKKLYAALLQNGVIGTAELRANVQKVCITCL